MQVGDIKKKLFIKYVMLTRKNVWNIIQKLIRKRNVVHMRKGRRTVRKVVKEFCRNHKSLTFMFFYMIIYLVCFQYLEKRDTAYHVIHFGIDAYIPFCEYFVIPYFLWFAYVAFSVICLGFKDREECNKLVAFLTIGMTVFIVVSALFPNGHNLRPKTFTRDNLCVRLVKWLYTIDTSTNVVPSIHVYNSIAVMIASVRTKCLEKHPIVRIVMLLLGVFIICSTVLIKQHSMLDVCTAVILSVLVYTICYRDEYATGRHKEIIKVKF